LKWAERVGVVNYFLSSAAFFCPNIYYNLSLCRLLLNVMLLQWSMLSSSHCLINLREYSSKVNVNKLRMFCVMTILLSTCSSLLISNANYNLAYVRRQINRVTHNLARVPLFQSSLGVYHYHPHDCIPPLYWITNTMSSFCLKNDFMNFFNFLHLWITCECLCRVV
jgi:hypothetical protein